MFGSTETRPPASLTRLTASMAVSSRGEPRASEEPEMWSQSASSGRRPRSAGRSLRRCRIRARGRRSSCSPVDAYATKATAVASLGCDQDAADVDPVLLKTIADELAEGVIAHDRAERGRDTEPRGGAREDRRCAARERTDHSRRSRCRGNRGSSLKNSASTSPTTRRDISRETQRSGELEWLVLRVDPPGTRTLDLLAARQMRAVSTPVP